jgi:hypothetical protein
MLDTVNSEQYVNDILVPLFEELTEEENSYAYFQQKNALAHTA